MQTNNLVLYQKMEQTYRRFIASRLSRKAFCQTEGLNLAQFTYWCQRFDKELPLTTSPIPEPKPVAAPTSTPNPAKGKATNAKTSAIEVAPPVDAASGFTELILPMAEPTVSTPAAPTTPTATPVVVNTPLMVLDLPGKARLEFYTPVDADFLWTLLQKGC